MSQIEALVQHMQFQWQRHEILANNLANTSTPGFKRDDLAIVPDAVAAATYSANVLALPAGGSFMQWTDFSQGFVQGTGRGLDAAINGSGFFVVDTPAGPRYTRAGAFNVGRDDLLTGPTGAPVLGRNGRITITAGNKVTIGAGGEVVVDGRLVDTLRVVDFPRPYRMLKEGEGLFVSIDRRSAVTDAKGYEIAGAALEASNVGTVQMMVSMIDVLRTYEAAQRAMQAVEVTNQHATSEIGKVS
jgi:flagellar basal-body rod protein FlgG